MLRPRSGRQLRVMDSQGCSAPEHDWEIAGVSNDGGGTAKRWRGFLASRATRGPGILCRDQSDTNCYAHSPSLLIQCPEGSMASSPRLPGRKPDRADVVVVGAGVGGSLS